MSEQKKAIMKYDLEQSVLEQSVKNRNFNEVVEHEYKFMSLFPRVTDYDNINQVIKFFPFIGQTNSQLAINNIKQQINQSDNYFVFLLGSTNDDDIHKAIKYKRWTSTENVNFMIAMQYINFKLKHYKDP